MSESNTIGHADELRKLADMDSFSLDYARSAMRSAAAELDRLSDRDEWKRLATDRNVVIGTLGMENERLRGALGNAADMLHQCALECSDCDYGEGGTGKDSDGTSCGKCAAVREAERCAREIDSPSLSGDSTALRLTPSAWMRGVSSYIPGEPTEYDVEVVPDCDGPPDDGNEWIALYRRAEDVK